MTESLFQRLRDEASPSGDTRDRVRASVQARIGTSSLLDQAKAAATPPDPVREAVWRRVKNGIENPVSSLLGRVAAWLTPSDEVRSMLRTNLLMRLEPVPVRSSYMRTKWVAAFALVALAVRVSPVIFLAPRTVAESNVLFIPTAGSAEVALNGLWQPVGDELTINEPVSLRTDGGQATVLLHDDGTIRLDSNASVALYDLSDRPEPALDGPTLALNDGRIWVQGLLPAYVRAITVSTPSGDVVVHNGSVSVSLEGGQVIVQVWDHSATVRQGDNTTLLVTGEQARFAADGTAGPVTRMPESAYDNPWVTQNLQRDAVHQREIAQMQRERSAAKAGILPTSPLYGMKRVAEQVDVLLTLNPEAKLQKQIEQASTRLDEAVALVAEGSTGATVQVEEYVQAMQAIASGSGGNSAAQFLLRQEMTENVAGLSAALPTDAVYSVKKAVLEASAGLPVPIVDDSDVKSIILVETLNALSDAVASGDTDAARASYAAVQPYLPLLDSGATAPEVRKEAIALLIQAAGDLQASNTGTGVQDLAADLEPFLPQVAPVIPVVQHLSDEEVARYALQILGRIDTFDLPRPRLNQLRYEIGQISVHPDGGRILRELYHLLPGQDILSREVREAIQNLRKD
jgi:hypothetical protein